MKTLRRKRVQKGGNKQKSHSLSQLWRFAFEASDGKPFYSLQFGYNLGRLQEMCQSGVAGAQQNWWTPVEPLVLGKDWEGLKNLIKGRFKDQSGTDFDREFLEMKKTPAPNS